RLLIYKENSTNCYFSIYLFGWETLVINFIIHCIVFLRRVQFGIQAFSQTPFDGSKAVGTLRMNGKFRKK
ncbi:hypothetical protein, partial [Bacteroides thetaiotaomicron]|uniref:hypothetical protein n=1 Tax=Bacteroides thetaiotaomicron TaxID=818 RepID=UPI001CE2E402